MIYYCDDNRHLVCVPYSIDNLHEMAIGLDIKKCWFHNKKNRWHYDIPKNRIENIKSQCIVVTSEKILEIITNK